MANTLFEARFGGDEAEQTVAVGQSCPAGECRIQRPQRVAGNPGEVCEPAEVDLILEVHPRTVGYVGNFGKLDTERLLCVRIDLSAFTP